MNVKKESQDLIELISLDSTFVLDVLYATRNNFTKQILYKDAKIFIRRDVGNKLKKVQEDLKNIGLGLKIYDGYRPYAATGYLSLSYNYHTIIMQLSCNYHYNYFYYYQ